MPLTYRLIVSTAFLGIVAACSSPPKEGAGQAAAATLVEPGESSDTRVSVVTGGLSHPWGLAFLPGDEGILVTERPGRLRLVRDGLLDPEPVAGLPDIRGEGEGGLLDVALHPGFEENRLVYLSYSKPGSQGDGTTALARARFSDGRLEDVEDLFVADAWGRAAVNYGGRIVFDRAGFLFLTVGDRREENRAQELRDHVGTTIRLRDDGSVPDDNPFVGRDGARPEIYSYGHRNSQGMIVHPVTGEIWQTDSGPAGGDEINLIRAGANYGWPTVSFGNHYDGRPIPDHAEGDGMEPPLHFWNPSISPSGLMIYTGTIFPDWQGDLFIGSLPARFLGRLHFDGSTPLEEERLLRDRGDRIRAVTMGPDGFIYLLTDAADGALLRLEPAEASPGISTTG